MAALLGDRKDKRAWNAMESRAKALPRDYRSAYGGLKSYLWKFTAGNGKDIVIALAGILALFEANAAAGRKAADVTGTDLATFADGHLPENRPGYESAWRDSLNRRADRKRG